jgi:hypothetical protein
MNINELYQSIPAEMQGNMAISATAVSITGKDGKAQTWELGAEVDGKAPEGMSVVKAKEVKAINLAMLVSFLEIAVIK